MNKTTKYLFSGLSVLLLTSLVSCGGDISNTSTGTTSGGELTSLDDGDLVYDDNGNIVYKNVELKMWSVTTGDDANVQDSLIAKFNDAYKGMINVTTTHTSRYELETLLQNTMEFDKKNAPDVFFSHGSRAAEYVSKNWLTNLDPVIDKSAVAIDKTDFVDSLISSTTVNGNLYGIPQDVHSAMVEIRTDILKKNNLKVPTNYAELCSVSDTATKLASEGNLYIRGKNSDGYEATEWRKASTANEYFAFPISFGDMWVHEFAGYTAAVQNGAKLISDDGMPAWNSKETANGLQVLRDWVNPTATSQNVDPLSQNFGSDYDVGNGPFLSGNAIFKLLGPWEFQNDINSFDKTYGDEGGWKNVITTTSMANIFAKDATKDYAKKVKGEGHAYMVMSTVESNTKKCAAMVFADYMINTSGITWAKRGHLPSLKSVEQASEYQNDQAYIDYVSNWGSCDDYVVVQPTKYYSTIDTYYKQSVQRAMATQYYSQDIKDILQESYEDCMDYIDLAS